MASGMQLVVFPTRDRDEAKHIFSVLVRTDPYVGGPCDVGFRAGGLEVKDTDGNVIGLVQSHR